MIEIRRTSFWFALISIICIAILLANGFNLPDLQGLLIFSFSVWLVYLLNVRYNKADRKMQENYLDQIFWLQMNENILKDMLAKYYESKPGK